MSNTIIQRKILDNTCSVTNIHLLSVRLNQIRFGASDLSLAWASTMTCTFYKLTRWASLRVCVLLLEPPSVMMRCIFGASALSPASATNIFSLAYLRAAAVFVVPLWYVMLAIFCKQNYHKFNIIISVCNTSIMFVKCPRPCIGYFICWNISLACSVQIQ